MNFNDVHMRTFSGSTPRTFLEHRFAPIGALRKEMEKIHKKPSNSEKIFVSIACFSDPDVVDTVKSCLENAADASRVTLGICLQARPTDRAFDALNGLPQVAVDRIDVSEARGPIYARARCEKLMLDADYFLQIDCHSRFFSGWDDILIGELGDPSIEL